MDETLFITITHISQYAGYEAFRPGMELRLKKEHDNPYDDEAVAVYKQTGEKYGYVANCTHTVCRGTHSAGYMAHYFREEAMCTVRFVSEEFAIAEFHDMNR